MAVEQTTTCVMSPEPFIAWFNEYMRHGGFILSTACNDLNLPHEAVRRIVQRRGQRMTVDIIDTALINSRFDVVLDGRLILQVEDLYPDWWRKS